MPALYITACLHAKPLQSHLTLCGTIDCSPPGSSVHETLQVRLLKWVVIPFSRGSSQPSDLTCISFCLFPCRWALSHQHHLGSPLYNRQEENSRHTERRQHEDGHRGQSDYGFKPRNAKRNWKRQGTDSPLKPLEGAWLTPQSQTFRFQNCERMNSF